MFVDSSSFYGSKERIWSSYLKGNNTHWGLVRWYVKFYDQISVVFIVVGKTFNAIMQGQKTYLETFCSALHSAEPPEVCPPGFEKSK